MFNRLSQWSQSHLRMILVILLICSFGIRLFRLNQIPVTLTHDETVYAIQAKSLAIQGKTWDQKLSWFPLTPVDPWYAEWPASIMAPFFWITNNPLLAAHLPSAIMGALIPFLVGGLVWLWWKDHRVAVLCILVSIFNPFLWEYSRLSYDALYSTFFYLSGAVVLLSNFKNWKFWKLLSIPLFIAGFFEYQGFKLLLVPWIVGILTVTWSVEKPKTFQKFLFNISKNSKIQIGVVLACIILTLAYGFLLLPHQNVGNRLQFTIWSDTNYLTTQTNILQRVSLASPLMKLQANKVTVMLDFMFSHFMGTFDLQRLFVSLNASTSGYSVWRHGLFYLPDGLFLLVGLGILLTQKKQQLSHWLFLFLIAGLTLPALINTQSDWYELRAFLVYTLLPIVIAYGMNYLSKYRLFFRLLMAIYAFSIFSFGLHYFLQYPVYTADISHFSDRVTDRYLELAQQVSSQPITVVQADKLNTQYLFASYLLYTSAFNTHSVNQIAEDVRTDHWQIGNLVFKSGCVAAEDLTGKILIYESGMSVCKNLEKNTNSETTKSPTSVALAALPSVAIPAINDSGIIFKIVNDQVCENQKLPTYIWPRKISDFDLATLAATRFCPTWITDVSTL